MKKILKSVAMITASMMMLCSCNGNEKKDVTASELLKAALDSQAKFEELETVETDYIKYYYSLEEDWYSEFSASVAGNNAFADEVVVVKAASDESVDDIKSALEARISSRKDVLQSYAPVEYDKLCKSEVKTEGKFVYMIVGSDSSKAEKALEKLF